MSNGCSNMFCFVPGLVNKKLMGKSPILMGKSTISTGPCSIAMFVYQRVYRISILSFFMSNRHNVITCLYSKFQVSMKFYHGISWGVDIR